MISNNPASKLKASKSSREFEYRENEEVNDTAGDEGSKSFVSRSRSESRDNNTNNYVREQSSVVYLPRETRIKKTRGLLEFRPGRGEPRNYGYRPKNTYGFRKDRENTEMRGQTSGRKFQESLKTSETLGTSNKYYNDDKINKHESGYNLPEDPRISKMLRKLCMETDQDKSIAICHKLLDTLMLPDNAKYIRRAFEILADSLMEVIKRGPGYDTKYLAARALGRIGYVMEGDFKYFLTWLVKQYTRSHDDETKILLMKSLLETYALEHSNRKLFEFSTNTVNQIINQVDDAVRPELFMALMDVVLAISECYPEVTTHFRDVVDILVGWLIESQHSPEMADYASKSLQRLGTHWQTNLNFSVQLLGQFLEDLVSFSETLNQNSSGTSTPLEYISPKIETSLNQVTALTRVINTIFKCLGSCLNPINSPCITLSFLTDYFIKIISTAIKTLDRYLPENLIIAANEAAYILLGFMQAKSTHANEFLYNLIDIELSLTQDFSDTTLVSMLLLISKTIKEVSANLPIELVQKLLGPQSEILKLRQSPSIKVQNGIVAVYHSLLNLKNIPLLQEAYRYVLGDLERCYSVLVPSVNDLCQNNPLLDVSYNKSEAEITVLFLLRCLSDLANASSSIIGMWALRPSILELLAVKLKPYEPDLSLHTPSLQFSILYLFYSHCKRYNHFVSSSNLVFQTRAKVCDMLGLPLNINLGEGATSSPTSGHLTIILEVLTKMLSAETCPETKCLILNWSKEIITLSESYVETLYQKKEFQDFINGVVKSGYTYYADVVVPVHETLDALISNKNAKWPNEFLSSVAELCVLQMNSNNETVKRLYSELAMKLPWNITIVEYQKANQIGKIKRKYKNQLIGYNTDITVLVQYLHMSRGPCGEMQTQHFKKFMAYLLYGRDNEHEKMNANEHEQEWLSTILNNCWPLEIDDCEPYAKFFGDLALNSRPVLLFWSTWEAAQFCVNSKLRTPLGKPTDTFTNIESAIKKLAREITGATSNENEPNDAAFAVSEFKRVRILLEFMEHLEKVIYNASEGTATAMSQPGKPVRTFFHTNASTCREWFSRIRVAVIIVALYVGQSPTALRHGQALLKDLVAADKTNGADFERAVMYVAWAMLNLKESEALQGLYVWCSGVSNRKFAWLKAAADQACFKFENASVSYKKVLENEYSQLVTADENKSESAETKDNLKNEINHQVVTFIADQLSECYKNLNNWNDLISWKEKEYEILSNQTQNGGSMYKYSINNINSDNLKSVLEFEENDFVVIDELAQWKSGTKKKCIWSTYRLLSDTETDLYEVAMALTKTDSDVNVLKTKLDNCLLVTQTSVQENLRNLPCDFTEQSIILNHTALGLKNLLNGALDDTFTCETKNLKTTNASTLSKILWWAEYFTHMKQLNETHNVANLRLNLARVARKEGNFNLARKQIQKYFDLKKELCVNYESNGNQWAMLENISKSLIECDKLDMNTWSLNNVQAVMEAAKLMYLSHDSKELSLNLCASTAFRVSQRLTLSDSCYELRERGTRMLITLAKWVQVESNQSLLSEVSNPLSRFVTALPEIGLVDNGDSEIIPIQDMAVGKIYHFAVSQCPSLAKAWFGFGSWCYRWGRKMVDHSSESRGQLSDTDRLSIQKLMPIGTTVEYLQNVYDILSQTRAVADDEDIGSNEINTSEMIEAQLRTVPILNNAHPDHLQLLVEIWRQAQKRIYSYYELSAESYFKYLQLYGSNEEQNCDDCTTITATLRLLRLIVKHALELQNVLESGLASTPTQPWKAIIPQLFSRLNHPETYVRRRVSELLCRVAEDAPHLITFPAVVGAADGNVKVDLSEMELPNNYLSQPNEDEEYEDSESEKETTNTLNSCFLSMVETLSKQAPETIKQVQLLVKELRRITLLWDELWLGTLLQHNNEITRRLMQLEQEIAKVESNSNLTAEEKNHLIAEKHRILAKPIIFVLEQLRAITSAEPETPNEKLFQERFSKAIDEVINKLKNPVNPGKPRESWHPLKVLQTRLQQRAHKRASYSLKMADISPVLANLTDTVIAMPGLASDSKKRVTVLSVDDRVSILPTKTKPKKLIFHGSDGQTYTYLFKGLEDLHLDERIMQFLSIANTMMAKNSDSNGQNVYRARHYSVIPLGPRSGLISWVDGMTPVFALYKRWQQREASKACLKQNSTAQQPTVLRPSELFYNKLNEHGVKNLDNRKEWPLSVLKQVLTELMAETPDDLLAKELWCHSVNAGSWWQTVRNYSYSVAVMSIIGYIIGLGDRHLDNVLVDLSSGEVVHIDYNVCFEKGKTLRVPEKVPFRMTANIKAALGVTGVEGIFRLACEHVLKTMKKGRETLLTLLEAFVYDPLVDWTVGGADGSLVAAMTVTSSTSLQAPTGAAASTAATSSATSSAQTVEGDGVLVRQTRKELEREVTAAMFNVRCAEMKTDWINNRDEIKNQIKTVVEHLSKWLEEQDAVKIAEGALQDLHQQMALVKEAEANCNTGKHTLFTLPSRYSQYKCTYDAVESSRKALEEKVDDCEKHIALHNSALSAIRGLQLGQWIQELNFPIDHDCHMVFDLVKDFLQNAGQSSMIAQCEQSESELAQLAQQQTLLIRQCLDLLSQYVAIASNYPISYLEKHRSVCYLKWCRILLETKSTDACRDVMAQFDNYFAPESANNPLVQQVVSYSCHLQSMLNDANIRLQKSFERLSAEGIPDPGSSLDRAYTDAKSSVASFLRSEKGAAKAFECVNITALCGLNKRYLIMEAAAASAGDCLVDLTSMEGDWFLDEMHLMSSLTMEFSTLIPTQHGTKTEDSRVPLVMNCLKTANNIYKGLQELNINFHTIILPEALKTIQTEEPTVIAMVNELNDIILSIGCPLPEILGQLEVHLRFTIMEMDSPHGNAQNVVSQLRMRYDALLHSQSDLSSGSDVLTPGKMLLMGFNGLFDKLNVESSSLISVLSSLDIPMCWKKVDQFREAKALSAPVFNKRTRSVLEDIFLLKRVQTMSEFFSLCTQMACAFKGTGLASLFDDERLNKPIRRFTADYVSRQLLGVTSQTVALALCLLLQRMGLNVTNEVEQRDIGAESKVPLEELCRKLVDAHIKRGTFTNNVLAQASGLSQSVESTWRRREVARYLQQNVDAQRSTLQRLQLQLTAYHWLHEDIISLQHGLNNMAPLVRSNFMLELRKTSTGLLSMQGRLSEAREQQKALISSVEQRLKWAAGANPALSEVMAAFECASNISEDRLTVEQKLAVQVGNTCNALIHHEALRTRTSESISHDSTFLQLVSQWERACAMKAQCGATITQTEESLIQLLPVENKIDLTWIRNASSLISDMIATRQQQMILQGENVIVVRDRLRASVNKLKEYWNVHHHLMGDIRNLLKSMSKSDECSITDLQAYLQKYYNYSEKLTAVFYNLNVEELTVNEIQNVLADLKEIEPLTDGVYDDLLSFKMASPGGGRMKQRPPLVKQETVWQSPRKTKGSAGGGREQQRNAYAVGVWRRVRMKLEGRDPDPGRRYSLQEQVDYVIREATNLDNLALLYEGWTPWV